MSLRAALAALAVATGLAACASGAPMAPPPCESDLDCAEGKVCFAEGCGDPGKNVVVEASGGSNSGIYARDYALPDGALGKQRDFDLGGPLSLLGEFQRERTAIANPTDRTFYTDSVLLRAVGESALIPGVTRSFEQRFERPERGFFKMSLGAGRYRVTALAADPSVPPLAEPAVLVEPGAPSPALTFAFPSVEGTPTLSGQLVKTLQSALLPGEPVALTAHALDLQAFDVDTREPLSQRFPVSSGQPGSRGDFAMTLSPEVRSRSALLLVATPREAGAPVPTKEFLVEAPFPNTLRLEMGDFGEPVPVAGRVVDPSGSPVRGALVVVEGQVVGDGTFRSRVAETDGDGRFTLLALPSRADGALTLTVAPPRDSAAAYTRSRVQVAIAAGEGTLSPATIPCVARLEVEGTVLRPDGAYAAGVTVRASPQREAGASATLIAETSETLTDDAGRFTLHLDPGTYRFEFLSPEELPAVTRLITVEPTYDQEGRARRQVQLREVSLATGRRVTGTVTGTMGGRPGAGVPYARLRFFRVTQVEGKPAAILLGSTVADAQGAYRVVLPSR